MTFPAKYLHLKQRETYRNVQSSIRGNKYTYKHEICHTYLGMHICVKIFLHKQLCVSGQQQ